MSLFSNLAPVFAGFAGIGVLQAACGLHVLRRFFQTTPPEPKTLPPITILKPVCGPEALLEEALTSFCTQDYPSFQLIIGAHAADDPALQTARRLAARFPSLDITLVANPALHGANRKISNLINMLPAAKHDLLVFADSDLHVRPDYLRQIAATLAIPGTGLVTTLVSGEAIHTGAGPALGASHISHCFLPGAALGFALGRQDCLGNTMALHRHTMQQAGGLMALANHLADDHVLGRLVKRQGLAIRLAPTLPVVTVQEPSLATVWQHELRWARTIRALEPAIYAGSILQYPTLWALLALLTGGLQPASVTLLLLSILARASIAASIDTTLAPIRARPARPLPLWIHPLRDLVSAAEILAAFTNNQVVWRGHRMQADRGRAEAAVVGFASGGPGAARDPLGP